VSSFRNDLPHNNVLNSIPVIPWFIKKNYSENLTPDDLIKSKKISLLASNKKNHFKKSCKKVSFCKKNKRAF
jgi:hypothetical protein